MVVVVSMIGFKLATIPIGQRFDLASARRVELEVDQVLLDEVVIEAKQPRALRRLRGRVDDLLFSSTPAGSRCEVENPEALVIRDRSGALDVVAQAPVRVLNPFLGYRLTVHGLRLEGTQHSWRFTGRIQYAELPPGSDRALRRTRERRSKAYLGSRQHFFRALAQGTLRDAGFRAELVQRQGSVNGGQTIGEMYGPGEGGPAGILFGDPGDATRSLMFGEALLVRYRRAAPHPAYSSFLKSMMVAGPTGRDRVSWLVLPTGIALLNQDGVPFSDGATPPIAHFGYWSWERVCDALPAGWRPESD